MLILANHGSLQIMKNTEHLLKTIPSALAPFLRSEAQGLILEALFLGHGEHTISSLAKSADTSPTTASREVSRLVAAEVVTARSIGRIRLVTVNTRHALYAPTRAVLAYAYGLRAESQCTSRRR